MEKVEFQTPREGRDLTLVGNYWSADSDVGIVMAHGFTGNKEQFGKFTEIAEELNKSGLNVLSFDFSGCGESDEDSITVEKEVTDLKSAIQFLKSRNIDRIGLLGLSQGGLVSLKVSDPSIEAIFLMAPATDSLKNYRSKLSDWQLKELEEYGISRKYRPDSQRKNIVFSEKCIEEKENINQNKLLEDIRKPVMIVHGTKDTSIPIEKSERAVEILENGKLKKIEDNHYFENSVNKIAKLSSNFFLENIPISET